MHAEQIARIRTKLAEARGIDKRAKVFGADKHGYRIGERATGAEVQAFEQQYGILLPACYRAFLLQLGGGAASGSPVAGPYFGIYPLGSNVTEFVDDPLTALKQPAAIFPGMEEAQWSALTGRETQDEIPNERIFAGILPLGSQGCTYYHGLVVTGEHAGRVVNIDVDLQRPRFCFEMNFLDWYERWLDEIISGILLVEGASWFGYSMGGTDAELMSRFDQAIGDVDKRNALAGLQAKIAISGDSIARLLLIAEEGDAEFKDIAVRLLTKFCYARAVPLLAKQIDGDDRACLAACQSLYWYAKSHAGAWRDQLSARLARAADEETVRFAGYLLELPAAPVAAIRLPWTQRVWRQLFST